MKNGNEGNFSWVLFLSWMTSFQKRFQERLWRRRCRAILIRISFLIFSTDVAILFDDKTFTKDIICFQCLPPPINKMTSFMYNFRQLCNKIKGIFFKYQMYTWFFFMKIVTISILNNLENQGSWGAKFKFSPKNKLLDFFKLKPLTQSYQQRI